MPSTYLSDWGQEESKRDFLDRLFERLKTTDSGRQSLVKLARFLMEQRSFPDLKGWENSEAMIKAAYDAVERLRIHYNKQEEELQTEADQSKARMQFLEKQAAVSRSQQTLQRLSERLNELGKRLGEQKAGYEFQNWFYDLVDFSEISNRRPYVDKGRQIDGSVTILGTTYIVELRFKTSPEQPDSVGDFFKKISTKADNTMGIFLSISGFTEIAKEEASGDKTPMLLLDHSHIYLVLGGLMGLQEVIDRVRRHASQTGRAYLAASDFSG